MRQVPFGVRLELDAFLEVDQIQLDIVGTVAEGQIRDQRVQQSRLAGAGFSGDHHVLRGARPEFQVLEFHGAGAAQGNVDSGAAVELPRVLRLGAMWENGTSTCPAVAGGAAHGITMSLNRSASGGWGKSTASGP